ncbi:MAG: 50S ribosomal protein L25 [Spirochaetales bacterium]|nr:50S ribosomal protein L25 [Spirochaetales bacterium]
MKKRTLEGVLREKTSKGSAQLLRRNGKIPSVVYGHTEPFSIAVDEHEFNSKFKTISENIIINLNVAGKSHDVLVKDYQENILTGKIVHLDFYEIEMGKLLKTHVPIHTVGTPLGAKEGGIFELLLHEVEVECLPRHLPEEVSVDVNALNVGDSIHIRDVEPPEGVKFHNSPDAVICHVTRRKEEKAAVEEEAEEGVTEEKAEEKSEE